MEKSWREETATFANPKKKWLKSNSPRGQCLVTSVLINDLFGGKIVYDRTNHHFWNELPDKTWQDFSRSQFKTETPLKITKYKTKREVLSDEHAIKHNTAGRYLLLKQKFEEVYSSLS